MQTELPWLQDPSKINRDNQNNIKYESSRHFSNKRSEYPKYKINQLAMNSKNKYARDPCRGIHSFKKGYQTKSNIVKNKNAYLLADSHNILNRWSSTSLSY
jgi:hypothetical protein